jgi:hypothetical protein
MSTLLRKLLIAGAVMTGAITAATGTASADIVDCVPQHVRAANDRVDFRCQGNTRWFIALRSNTDATALGQMLSVLNSSVVSGKSIKVYYNLDSASNGIFWGIEIYR